MTITDNKNGSSLEVIVEGRLDTTTAPELDQYMQNKLDDVTSLTINMKNLEYVSSAGLRVLLSTQKIMNKKGTMVITNVCEEVAEIFEVTGFSDILTIK